MSQRLLYKLTLPKSTKTADVTAKRAVSYGVTLEINTCLPYDCPQSWARSLDVHHGGIRYFLRHDSSGARGLAIFDDEGESGWDVGEVVPISERLVETLYEEYGLEVLRTPESSELRIVS